MSRLPTPGGDDGTWGDILNAYLEVSHASDGTLNPGVVGHAQLDSSTQGSISSADSAVQSVNNKTGTSITLLANDVSAVPVTRQINGKALSGDITLTASDINAVATSQLGAANGLATLNSSSQLTSSQLPGSIVSGGSSSTGTGQSITFLPLPTGVAATDTTHLNTVLAQGGRIRPNPLALAASYSLNAPLVLASGGNTDIDFGDCTLVLTGQFNMLQNSAVKPPVTATDASTTIGSSVITSPTIAPHAAAGMQIAVVGAGYNSQAVSGNGSTWLYGTVQSVSGNNITVGGNVNGVQATFAVSNATAYLWETRDSNIRVKGGIWNLGNIWSDRTTRWNAANNTSTFRFRRVDNLVVRHTQQLASGFTTGGPGWCFGIDFADCTDVICEDHEGVGVSTVTNCTGPLARVTVRDIRGTSADDMVAFGTTGAAGADTEGDISDLVIEGVMSNSAYCAVDLYSGQGNYNAVRYLDATVRGVKGVTQLHCVRVQDYAGQGQINARIEDVTARTGANVLGTGSPATSQQGIWNNTATGKIATVPGSTFEPMDQGMLLASCDPYDCNGSSASPNGYQTSAGYVILAMLKVPRQVTLTNLIMGIQVAGASLTPSQNLAGVYDGRTLALIAKTVDQSTAWQSVGQKTMALTAQTGQSLTIPGGPGKYIWAAFLCNGTTMPSFVSKMTMAQANLGGSSSGPPVGILNSRAAFWNISGQTTLPTSLSGHPIGSDADLVFIGAN